MEQKSNSNSEKFKNKDLLTRLKDYEANFISDNNNNETDEEKKEILEEVFQGSKNIRNNFFKNYLTDISDNLNGHSDNNSYHYMDFFRNFPNNNFYTFSKKLNSKENEEKEDNKYNIENEELNIYENKATMIEKEADEQIEDIQISDDENIEIKENNQLNENNNLDENNLNLFEKLNDNNDKEPDYNCVQNNICYNDENNSLNEMNIKEKTDKKGGFNNIIYKNKIKGGLNTKLSNNIMTETETYFKNKKIRFHKIIKYKK